MFKRILNRLCQGPTPSLLNKYRLIQRNGLFVIQQGIDFNYEFDPYPFDDWKDLETLKDQTEAEDRFKHYENLKRSTFSVLKTI